MYTRGNNGIHTASPTHCPVTRPYRDCLFKSMVKHDRQYWIATAMAVFIALALPLRTSGVAPMQTALALALLLGLLQIATQAPIRTHFMSAIKSTQAKMIGFGIAGLAISIPWSLSPLDSFLIVSRTALFILGCVVFWAVYKTYPVQLTRTYKVLIVAVLIIMFAAILSIIGVPHILPIFKGYVPDREFPIIAFKGSAATVMCLVPVFIWLGWRFSGVWRWLCIASLILLVTLIVQTGNRASMAGLAIMAIMWSTLYIVRQRKSPLLLAALLAAISATTIAVIHQLGQHAPHLKQSYLPEWLVDPHRQQIWRFSFERFLDSPLVGSGINQLNNLPGANLPAPGLPASAAFVPSHPHNWILEVIAEAGLFGFVPVIIAIIYLTWKFSRDYTQHGTTESLVLACLFVGFWGSALFNFSIWSSWWLLTLFTLTAIVSAPMPKNGGNP